MKRNIDKQNGPEPKKLKTENIIEKPIINFEKAQSIKVNNI